MPPLNSLQIIPVPPPTLPSATAPPRAESSASKACSGFTWKPFMSFRWPSHVSATTGSDHRPRVAAQAPPCLYCQAMTASRTTPTLWVFVIMTGDDRKPDSSSQVVPVISPLPFRVNQPPKTGSAFARPRGKTAVTPVRTGPSPTTSLPSPLMIVLWPTSTPLTSVIAFSWPGVPSKGTPRSRARGRAPAAPARLGPAARRMISPACVVFVTSFPPGRRAPAPSRRSSMRPSPRGWSRRGSGRPRAASPRRGGSVSGTCGWPP